MTNILEFQLIQEQNNFNKKTSNYKEEKLPLTKQPLERVPISDSFTPSKEIKISKKEEQKNKIALLIGAIGLTSGALVSIVSTRRINTLKESLDTAQRLVVTQSDDLSKLKEELTNALQKATESSEEIKKLKDLLEGSLTSETGNTKFYAVLKEKYREIINNPELHFNPIKPDEKLTQPFRNAVKVFKITTAPSFIQQQTSSGQILNTYDIMKRFLVFGEINLQLPTNIPIKIATTDSAFIRNSDIAELGKTIKTDILLNYGKRINWSEEKIARDIMQNFYDGHGNTLDGVQLIMEKLPDRKTTKIKILGRGLFDYKNLQYFGSGTKETNPYNAGGFGEGTKILVTNLLSGGDTKSVKFCCADWDFTFGTDGDVMTRTLKKSDKNFLGNSIEFETTNTKLINSIIDSLNYFKHSQNADFMNLTYDSKDFGFKILENGEKGNIYLTQRFEFGQSGEWTNPVENLILLFKRKPDAKKYEEITGQLLPKDRDRTHLTAEDIKNLTRYFATEMSDEDIIASVLETKKLWKNLGKKDEENKPIKMFIQALGDEMEKRRISIDFEDEKFVYRSYGTNDVVRKTLSNYGYTILPEFFSKLGLNSSKNVFENLSKHKTLQPTQSEIEKLKTLDETIKLVKEEIDKVLKKYLSNPKIKFSTEFIEKKINQNTFPFFAEMIQDKTLQEYRPWEFGFYRKLETMTQQEKQELTDAFNNFINKKLNEIKDNIENKNSKQFLQKFMGLCSSCDNLEIQNYGKTIKSLSLIDKNDLIQPKYIFDRKSEIASDTLGESIVDYEGYHGHWIDREYLNNADFYELLSTWLHEICHKSGGDGTAAFTYTLTDMINVLFQSNNGIFGTKLKILKEIFEEIK